MALLFNDEKEFLLCKCGNKTFTEEKVFIYKRESDRRGVFYRKEKVSTQPRCTKCGILHSINLQKEIIEEVN
jgi:hypothetical protein